MNGSSIDITLGSTLLIERAYAPLAMDDQIAVEMDKGRLVSAERLNDRFLVDIANGGKLNVKEVVMNADGYVLKPNSFVLGHSEQEFHLPDNISADYHLKSTIGRVGLEHLNAGWCDPWWHGSKLTLELKNLTRFHRLLLRPGMPIGQLTFHRHKPVPKDKGYAVRGRYNNDPSVSGAKPNLSITK